MSKTKNQIFEEITSEMCSSGFQRIGKIPIFFEISPHKFIEFANFDLDQSYEHNIVNALSNAKRGLDCQLDLILLVIGYFNYSQSKKWGFPKKIELLNELGILAPRILNKINKQRNLLEHQFVMPKRTEVEDFIDVSMLFLASVEKYTNNFISSIKFDNSSTKMTYLLYNTIEDQQLIVGLYPEKTWPGMKIIGNPFEENLKTSDESAKSTSAFRPKLIDKFVWSAKDTDFKNILKLYLSFYN